MPILLSDLDNWFTYHTPDPHKGDFAAYGAIRRAGKRLAEVILNNTPSCADQSAAIRKVREAVMTANAARACNEELPPLRGR
jgi:hypothetical protein